MAAHGKSDAELRALADEGHALLKRAEELQRELYLCHTRVFSVLVRTMDTKYGGPTDPIYDELNKIYRTCSALSSNMKINDPL